MFRFADTIDDGLSWAIAPLAEDHPNAPLRAFLTGTTATDADDWRTVRDWVRQRDR